MRCPRSVLLAALLSLGGTAAAVTLPSDLIAVGTATDPSTGLPLEVRTRVTSHVLCLVPPGNFTMGSDSGDVDEKPVHVVSKSAFYLGKYPVTNLQYEQFAPQHHDSRGAYAAQDQHPVARVRWNDASAYILWIGTQENKPDLYAMPSEAAWEKAAQGGLNTPTYPWGNTLNSSTNLYSSASAVVVDGGSPNGLGFHHMTANVFCWCWDWYDKNYYQGSPAQDPYGPPTGKARSLRGGTWYIYNKSFRCADRWSSFPTTVSDHIGIRIGRRVTDILAP